MKAALILAMTASTASATCLPWQEMDAKLKRFGEVPIMIGEADENTMGIHRHVLYIGQTTYTMVEIYTDGIACYAAVGHNSELLQLPGQGT
jgi:hypothetical protein